ncbi:Trm112 family protein [Desulfosediminicola ganghwensis]|uniref:Trm112 family protein n=1 Tax=Desulfosediminicola ganghwensis TaxID=2569540 RepID=UPI0010AB59E9|nr:Trm112 family protein [Desulfosediminicola ganghwensis]
MIDKDLLAILACPKCKGHLKYLEAKEGLACETCLLLYEVRENIPVMVIEEAKTLKAEDLEG